MTVSHVDPAAALDADPTNGPAGTAEGLEDSGAPAGPTTPGEPTDGDADPGDGGDLDDSPNAEAARYRKRLRATEKERDTLADQLAATRRSHVEAHLASAVLIDGKPRRLSVPGDLVEVGGVDLASLFRADGSLDADAVQAAVTELYGQRPGLFEGARSGPYVPKEGGSTTPPVVRDSFADAVMAFAPGSEG